MARVALHVTVALGEVRGCYFHTEMNRLGLMLGLWTLVVIGVVLFWPSGLQTPECASLIEPPAGCTADLAAANRHLWWTYTLPSLVFFASGYLVIVSFEVRRSASQAN